MEDNEVPKNLTLPLDGPRGLLLPDQGPGRRPGHRRERRLIVAQMLLSGYPIGKIAQMLHVSRGTVLSDRRNLVYAWNKALEGAGINRI